MDLKQITLAASEIVKNVGSFQLKERIKFKSSEIVSKGKNDLVSYVDIESEKKLVKGLSNLLPESGFLTEEATLSNHESKEFFWIIDPLDGTTNFIHGLPSFGISIALASHEELLIGIVYEPNQDELFHAWKEGGAYCNNERISISLTEKFEDCLFATGFPINNHDTISNYLAIGEEIIKNSRGLRRLGSASIDLIYTAIGRFDGFYEYNLKPWDVAGGAIIIKEAGGKVSDFEGGENWLHGESIIAANPNVFEDLKSIVQKNYFN